jgi:glycosyltransferase involved in cell wall biosynthesis
MANQTRQLARLLGEEGLHVELIQTNAPYKPSWIERWRGIRALFRLLPYLRVLWKTAGRVELFHVMANSGWSWHLFAAPAIWIGWWRGIPVVLNYRGGEIEEFFQKSFHWVRPSLDRVAAVIVPSGYTADVFRRRGYDVRLVKNIIDTGQFTRSERLCPPRAAQGPHLLVTRNLEPIYDIGTALHVLQRLVRIHPEARLTVCGSGPDMPALVELARELGISEAVTFTGNLDNNDIAPLYRSADIMLNTSLADNMPVSVLEALASGVPVVSTNVGGVPYLVEHGKTALLAEPRDHEAMAEAVLSLLGNPEMARTLVTNGLTEIRNYTWSRVRQDLLSVYASVVETAHAAQPRLLVYSSLFPSSATPGAGLFIRERMFRVARQLPVTVISPRPWFPGQELIRRFRPHVRQRTPRQELQDGVTVYYPRFFSFPLIFKQLDGVFMALGSYTLLRRLGRLRRYTLLDAHFAYPDGYAATLLGKWLRLPVTITLRGTEVPHSRNRWLRPYLTRALLSATRLFSVSESLRQHAIALGVEPGKIRVMANGVDAEKFHPLDRLEARRRLGIAADTRLLVSVGALVKRKGFHRVIEVLPELIEVQPKLQYLIVGGASAEGDMQAELEQQVRRMGLESRVHFLGTMPPAELKWPLSAADLFVLATANEGWANVFLEAMACGLPVIATDVGGNAEVVCRPELGTIVPFGDPAALRDALQAALSRRWDRGRIRAYAEENAWDTRIASLTEEFTALAAADTPATGTPARSGVETGLK